MAIRPTEPLIFDRTLSDVQQNRAKGNYNATDLNRIEEWENYLKELLDEFGYHASFISNTDWEIGLGKPNMTSEINRIKNNLQKLKDTFYDISGTPPVPSTDRLAINYIEANDIEKIMADMEFMIGNIESAYRYADFLVAGEDLGMPNIQND